MNQAPVAIALLACEQVIVEAHTGNVTPVNCFTHLGIEQFPSEKSTFMVFADMTNGLGKMPLEVVIQKLDGPAEPVFRVVRPFHFTNPLSQVRLRLRVHCSFPTAGQYEITLKADQELIAHRKMRVFRKEKSA